MADTMHDRSSDRRLGAAEFYRSEATRLRAMAVSSGFRDVRDGLLRVAHEYDLLAEQRDDLHRHRFGEPFRRPAGEEGYPSMDSGQDNAARGQRAG